MMRLPKTVPMPAPEPATPTVAAPAPMNLAAVSMSRWAALVWMARWALGRAWGDRRVGKRGGSSAQPPPRGLSFPPSSSLQPLGEPQSGQGAQLLPCAPPRAGAQHTPAPPAASPPPCLAVQGGHVTCSVWASGLLRTEAERGWHSTRELLLTYKAQNPQIWVGSPTPRFLKAAKLHPEVA